MRRSETIRVSMWTAIALIAFLLLNSIACDSRSSRETSSGACGESWIVDTFLGNGRSNEDSMKLNVVYYDVGLGDAALYELPGQAAILVDGGSVGKGKSVICPDLKKRGIDRINVMVMTHPHYDHCGGLAEVFECVEVGEVWTNGQRSRQKGFLRFEEALKAWGGPVVVKEEGDRAALGGLTLKVLHSAGGYKSRNNNSMVLMLQYRGTRILATADIEFAAQRDMAAQYGKRLGCDIVRIPSHGHARFSQDFVDLLGSRYAVLSVGPNKKGYPSSETIEAYAGAGMEVLRTDENGNIRFTIDGGDPVVITDR